jgi:hypothetical protein
MKVQFSGHFGHASPAGQEVGTKNQNTTPKQIQMPSVNSVPCGGSLLPNLPKLARDPPLDRHFLPIKQNKRQFSPCPCRLRFSTHKCVIPGLSRRSLSMHNFVIQLMVKWLSAVGSVMRRKSVKKIRFSARMAELAIVAPVESHSLPRPKTMCLEPSLPNGRGYPWGRSRWPCTGCDPVTALR